MRFWNSFLFVVKFSIEMNGIELLKKPSGSDSVSRPGCSFCLKPALS